MTTHALTVRIVADPTAGTIPPEDGYWLTIVQLEDDQRITAGEAAAMIDALFDLSPCVDTAETGAEPVEEPPADMGAALDKIAEEVEVDLTACERRKMGTYRARLKIVRSHPAEPYTLRLSVGEIIETTIVESAVAESVDVQAATFIALTMPVQGELRCSWQGTVYGLGGPIDQPVIQLVGNTLFWAGTATGSIRAEYSSIHDLVEVEIPGIPNYPGAALGQPQDSSALAFYHYQVYQCDITPPAADQETTLAEVCGWLDEIGGDGTDDDEPLPEPPPPPESVYGCIDYYPLAPFGSPVTEPWFYEQTCCVPGSHDGCRTRTSRLEGGKGLSPETVARMTASWPGPIEFIGLGPITPEGCGTRYEETKIIQHNCCDEVEPMAWDTETSVEVLAPGTSGIVGVIGGSGTYHWSVRGNDFWLDSAHTLRDGMTDTGYTRIYAGANACGTAPITVSDGCSVIIDDVRSTEGRWNDECRVLSIRTEGSGMQSRYVLTKVCDPPVSVRIGSDTIYDPPPSPNILVNSDVRTYQNGAWNSLGGYCTIADNHIIESGSFYAAVEEVSENIRVVYGFPSGPPDGSEYHDIDGFRCRWLC